MRRIAADYIFPVSAPPLKNGIIEFDDQGKILSLTDTHGDLKEISRLEYYNGVLVPGFILPYLRIEPYIFRTSIRSYNDLIRFINQGLEGLVPDPETDRRFHDLDLRLFNSGIRSIGCITSRFHFFNNKSEGSINYHSFIEIPPNEQSEAYELFNKAIEDIMTAWNEYGLPASVIPFNCSSEEIMEHIADFSAIHDNPLILGCSGNSPNSILDNFSAILSRITGRGKKQAMTDFRNPILIISDDLPESTEILTDRTFLILSLDNLYHFDSQLCENEYWNRSSANILFSSQLVDYNSDVEVIYELKSLQAKFPLLHFQDLLRCFTLNPARALGMDHQSGTLIPGKKPGLNLITNFDYDNFKLKETSEIVSII
jgi:aminodeoxyfutalosine deaminase